MVRLSAVALSLFLSAPSAFAQTATITGHIVDTTGAPISPSASPSDPKATAVVRDASGNFVSSADAGGAGGFTIGNLAPGTYYVHTTNRFGYVNETADGFPCVGDCALQGPLVLTAGATRNIEFVLDKGAVVSGTVRDAITYAALAAAEVFLYDAKQRVVAQAVSSATGAYVLTETFNGGMAASTYYASVEPNNSAYLGQMFSGVACNFRCRLNDATPIRVGLAQSVGGIDFALARAGAISGRVTDAVTGAPIAGIGIRAWRLDEPRDFAFGQGGFTDAAGGFTLTNVSPGSYAVTSFVVAPYLRQGYRTVPIAYCTESLVAACQAELRTLTPVNVIAGATTGAIDFQLRRGGSIAGRITQGGQGIAGTVLLYDAAGIFVRSTPAAATGEYATTGLPAGSYFVKATSFRAGKIYASVPCDFAGCAPTTGTPVVLTDGAQTSGIDFDFPAPGSISGTIRSSATGATMAAFVEVFAGDRPVGSWSAGADGAYSLSGLPPGAYRVRASAAGFMAEWYNNVCEPCGNRGGDVTVSAAGSTTGIDFSLDPAGKITGVITLGTPARSPGVIMVSALRADGSVVSETSLRLPLIGAYTIDGLPTGSYYVRATSNLESIHLQLQLFGGGYAPELYDGVDCDGENCPLTAATPVAVTAGLTRSGINLTMDPGAIVEGHVVPEGTTISSRGDLAFGGLKGAVLRPSVQAYTPDGRRAGNFSATTLATSPGAYVIAGLRPGRYFFKATGGSGYADMLYRDLTCPGCSPASGTPVVLTGPERRTGIDFHLTLSGAVAGTVRDETASSPISGVTVTAFNEAGIVAATTLTNAAGGYVIDGLGGGRYYIATSNLLGYADEVFDNVACGTCDPLRGRAVEVQGGSTTGAIDFGLGRGVLIGGRVSDAGGSGAGPATVSFFNSSGALVARTSTLQDIGSLGNTGAYAASVPAGTTFARLEPRANLAARLYDGQPCPGGSCDPTTGTPITGVAGQTIVGIDFLAPVCGPISLMAGPLPAGIAGTSYSTALTASPGGPFTYALQAGTLPPGIALGANGAISGTPSSVGHYAFTVGAADTAGCGTSRAYAIDVTGCTPSLSTSSLGVSTFDVAGPGGLVRVTLDSSCPAASASNAPWLHPHPGADPEPGVLPIVVDRNAGGRRTGTVTVGNRTVTINQSALTTTGPFGTIDTPADGAVVNGSLAVSGWVLDDLRVNAVRLYRGDVFIGNATLVPGARPDVEHLFPEYPYASRAGWGYLLLTNMLPNQGNGTFTLTAIAEDVEGNRTTLGSRTIVANNAAATEPFGAIDTPPQGETIFGPSYVNFGWALTPKPKTIPTNGSTIGVFIDGAPVGAVTYNNPRSDIAALFPGLNNSNGPVGYRFLDTTTLADGVHTIAWVVSDDGGAAAGIGSRYFTVANGTGQLSSGLLTPPALQIAPARAVAREVVARELDRIVIDLGDGEPASCRAVFSGVERVGAESRPLPIGSSLDREGGVFRWQPGPGFQGTYHLSFDVGQCDGSVTRTDVDVTIAKREALQ